MTTEKNVTPGPSDLTEENRQLKAELEAVRADLVKKEATLKKYKDAMKVGKEAINKLRADVQQLQEVNNSNILDTSVVAESNNGDVEAQRDKQSAEALRGRSGSLYSTITDNKLASAVVVIAATATAVAAYRKFG